jgi:hypothetical protein
MAPLDLKDVSRMLLVNPTGKLCTLLETVHSMVTRVLANPNEPKYQRIKPANKSIKAKILGEKEIERERKGRDSNIIGAGDMSGGGRGG